MKTLHIIIVGAGASGLMAAIQAASLGARVTVLEKKEKPGKKILATGNGRCNFTNAFMDSSCYHGNENAMSVIRRFGTEEVLSFFEQAGVLAHERNGYYYPFSDQASSITGALVREAQGLGVSIRCGCTAEGIRRTKKGFEVQICQKTIVGAREEVRKNGKKKKSGGEVVEERSRIGADRVILSCGGKASPVLGSDGSGYTLAQSLGHTVTELVPALTGIRCEEKWFEKLAGVRISARVTLFADGNKMAEETGELQLTDYGVSGIPVFQISRYGALALKRGSRVHGEICFFPELDRRILYRYLQANKKEAYQGLLPDKLLSVLIPMAEEAAKKKANGSFVKEMAELLNHLRFHCTAVNDFDRAQVTGGGIFLEEVNLQTMESKCCPGLYLAGELLDVDGICGGYNLQWAWSSGYFAGISAADKKTEE